MSALLARCRDAAKALAAALPRAGYAVYVSPTLDIVTCFPERPTAQAISAASERIFSEGERSSIPLYLAKLTVTRESFAALHPEVVMDAPSVTILRSCLMRPEQAQASWIGAIARQLALLDRAAG